MKIIKINTCEDCPHRSLSFSFASDLWTLSCQKDTQRVSEFKFISSSKYNKDKIKYDIPIWCTLLEE